MPATGEIRASQGLPAQGLPDRSLDSIGSRSSTGISWRIRQDTGPRVFVAMPFGIKSIERSISPDENPHGNFITQKVQINFDRVWRRLLRPALEQAGCKPYRADEEPGAGDIRTDMYFELVTGEFVLADISTLNANVFYELGIRHGVSPRGVLMIDGGWNRRPFDVAPDRTFSYRGNLFEFGMEPNDPAWAEKVERETDRLSIQLRAAISNDSGTVSSPVYKELTGLKPADWSEIQNAKARYFGHQLQEWGARVSKAKRSSHVGDILTLSCDAPNRLVEWQLRVDTAHALIDLGRYERARELLRAMVTEKPTCFESRYALAKTLTYLARAAEPPQMVREYQARAEQEIEQALNAGGKTPEAHRLLGRVYKYRWLNRWEHADELDERRLLAGQFLEFAKKGLSHYWQALMSDLGCLQAGLNLISLFRICKELGPNETINVVPELRDVIGLVKIAAHRNLQRYRRQVAIGKSETEVIWAMATLAEIELLSGEHRDEAEKLYQRVATHPDVSVSQLKTIDDQLEMYEKLGFQKESVLCVRRHITARLKEQPVFNNLKQTETPIASLPKIFVFKTAALGEKGHEEGVKNRIRDLLTKEWCIGKNDIVICSAQEGPEIILAEACIELEASVRLVLPLNRRDFVTHCVRKIGLGWDRRFFRLIEHCEVLEQPIRLGKTPVDVDPYDRNDIWCLDIARTEMGPYVRPRVISLSIGDNDTVETLNRKDKLNHYEQSARQRDLLVERVVVYSISDETTLLLPTCKTIMFVRRPNGRVETLPLLKEVRMGRSEKNDIVFQDRRISRYHLNLTPESEGIALTNLTSRPNATFLDGQAIAPGSKHTAPISAGQKIKLPDSTLITFKDAGAVEES